MNFLSNIKGKCQFASRPGMIRHCLLPMPLNKPAAWIKKMIKDKLAATKYFKVDTGMIIFDENRNP